ncbi:MAG: hypothetical protein WD342_17550 [Verrucomicrobiales bacterium]
MNATQTTRFCWRSDLAASRDLTDSRKRGFEILLDWYERWRLRRHLSAGRESARRFWKESVFEKPREEWQLTQWTAAMRWYLRWLSYCVEQGGDVRPVEERVRDAVDRAGARRGLARTTRQCYAGHATRYATHVRDTLARSGEKCSDRDLARALLDPARARDFLSWIVTERKVKGLLPEIAEWKRRIRLVHEGDRTADVPGVALPNALERKLSAGKDWRWFWFFPAPDLSTDPESGIERRHHLHGEVYSRNIRKAVLRAGIDKRVTTHVLRH